MSQISRRKFVSGAVVGAASLGLSPLSEARTVSSTNTNTTLKVALGSCLRSSSSAPVLSSVVAQDPDVFIWLGDNIYGDTTNMTNLRRKYQVLGRNPRFQELWNQCPNLAIWDDHDYGRNNAGSEYPKKQESKEIFLDFWQVSPNDERRSRPGIYGSKIFENDGGSLQVILLDGRTFRSPKKWNPNGTMLGEQQWSWLEEQLKQPSTNKLICSGIQVIADEHGYEGWYEYPHERDRLFKLIDQLQVPGVVFASGDQHWSEITRLDGKLSYPAFDFTCSSLDQSWALPRNSLRVGRATGRPNFGMITFDWGTEPGINFQIFDALGGLLEDYRVEAWVLS